MLILIEYLILFLMAILPPIIYLLIIYAIDKIEKEPKHLIFILFILGAISCFPIGFAELFLELFNFFPQTSIIGAFITNFMIVAVCEEVGKFIILFLITWWSKHLNYRYDAIVYSVTTSLGFATLENIMYVLVTQLENGTGFSTAITRMILAIPAHLCFSIAMGFFYALFKDATNRKKIVKAILYLFLSLIIPITTHGLYDFCLSFENIYVLLFFFGFVLIVDIICIALVIYIKLTDKPIYLNKPIYTNILPQNINQINNFNYTNNFR